MATRVLVVDDSATIRKVVASVLERHGFEAVQASDGQVALEKLAESASEPAEGGGPPSGIDVVLVDFVMPRMNGFQLCRAIRDDDRLRATPVVLMSAKSDRIREHFVQQTGAIDAITKPFDAQALIAVIENATRRSAEWRARSGTPAPAPVDGGEAAPALARPALSPETAARAALAGDLSVIPIGAVLQLLQMERQTGVLIVSDGKREITISMRLGLIDLVQSRGAGSEFRLGRYFVERGLLSSQDIDAILRDGATPPAGAQREELSNTGRRLIGDLLVDSGKITREQLLEALARQSSELVYEVLRWPEGRCEFRKESLPALAQSAQLGLPAASVVMEGFRRVDEWRVVEAGLGSFDAVLQADPASVEAMGVDRLTPPERKLLDMIDGERTVREIVEQSHMSSFDACRILFQLLEARIARRRVS
jgi:DNA-binding response OmpR family regulator